MNPGTGMFMTTLRIEIGILSIEDEGNADHISTEEPLNQLKTRWNTVRPSLHSFVFDGHDLDLDTQCHVHGEIH